MKVGRCRGRGRTADSKRGIHSLRLGLLAVDVLRMVYIALFLIGFGGMTLRHHGGLVEWQAPRSQGMQVRGAPGLSQKRPPNLRGWATRYPVATHDAQEWEAASRSSGTMLWGEAKPAATVWHATWRGRSPGTSTTTMSPLPAPPLQEIPAWRCAVGRLRGGRRLGGR